MVGKSTFVILPPTALLLSQSMYLALCLSRVGLVGRLLMFPLGQV
jgi:hypothetical protein